jgi:hypothetical protein
VTERIQRFFLYDEGEASIGDFIKLTPTQILTLAEFVDRNGFSGTPEDLLSLAQKLGVSYEKTADLVQYGAFLQSEKNRLELSLDGLIEEFEIFLERHGDADARSTLAKLAEPLKRLFADRPDIVLRAKVASITSAAVPEALDFLSICDLRPVFNEERDSILEYVPVALIRILVRSETREADTLVFQVSREGVKRLREFMDRLQKKMEMLELVRKGLMETKR